MYENFNDFFRGFFSHFFASPLQTALLVLAVFILYRTAWNKKTPR
jgi:hypothetical protein